VLEDLGLADAIRTECEHFSRRESIPAEVTVHTLPDSLPRPAAMCLFRVTQEALHNVVRHARAQAVRISLSQTDHGLQLAVHDDGVGFDPDLHRSRPSLGLASMLERTRLIGGELDINSAPGRGTTVVAWVPLTKQEASL
jgi:signal transduction histidine kinase